MRAVSRASMSACYRGFPVSFKRAEKKREAAKRREIMEKELKEKRLALEQEDLRPYEHGSISPREDVGYYDFLYRPQSMRPMQSDRPMGIPPPVKLPDQPSMEYVFWNFWNFIPRAEEEKKREAAKRREIMEKELKEHIALMRAEEEEEREAAPAMDPEIMELKLLEEQFAFKQEDFWSREPDPFFFPSFGLSLEEERTVSPALSCDSAQSDDSMNYPMAF